MAIEIVDLPILKMVIFQSYVSLPEGNIKLVVWGFENHYIVMEKRHRSSGLVIIYTNQAI